MYSAGYTNAQMDGWHWWWWFGLTDPPCELTYIESTQKEERGLQAHREDETEDCDSDQGTDAQWLWHDDNNDQRCQDSHPQKGR